MAYFTGMRTHSGSLLVLYILLLAARAWAQDCAVTGGLPSDGVFIGYTRSGELTLRSVALLRAGALESYDGRNLTVGLVLHQAAAGGSSQARIESIKPFLNILGEDHCVYPAEIAAPESKTWRIWTSKALGALRQPRDSQRKAFRELRPACVQQGDPPPGKEVCSYAELLAVSDIDSDGQIEYWHTNPNLWDTGLAVSERVRPNRLQVVITAFPGCSD